MTTYFIKRNTFEAPAGRITRTGLTLAQAQNHCNNAETSSTTASQETLDAERNKTGSVQWFDGYNKE